MFRLLRSSRRRNHLRDEVVSALVPTLDTEKGHTRYIKHLLHVARSLSSSSRAKISNMFEWGMIP